MTVHITLWNVLGVVGAGVWVLVSFYLAAGLALLAVMGGDGPEWWINLKAGLVGVSVMAVLIGVPLAVAAWAGAWK